MKQINEHTHQKIHVVLLSMIAATFVLPTKWNTWLIILCFLFSLLHLLSFNGIKEAFKSSYVKGLWLFFLLHVLSAFLSINSSEGFAIVERRASLLVFPVLLFLHPLSKEDIKKICLSFVGSVLSIGLFCIGWAVYGYVGVEHNADVFFYQRFTSVVDLNAVYLSAYCILSLHMLWVYGKHLSLYLVIPSGLILFLLCVLLSSKMMLFCLFFGAVILAYAQFKKRKAFLMSFVAVLVIGLAIYFVPQVRQRVSEEIHANMEVVHQNTYTYDTPFTGTSLRLVLWKYSFQLVTEKQAWLFGVKAGDFQDLLNEKYKSTGMYVGNPELKDTGYLGYGPHNQYMEVFLSLGIIGLLSFIYVLFYYMKEALRLRNYLALQFIVLFTLFFLSESVLSVNKGIVVFTFFSLLFLRIKSSSDVK